jgi:hypothetical protein
VDAGVVVFSEVDAGVGATWPVLFELNLKVQQSTNLLEQSRFLLDLGLDSCLNCGSTSSSTNPRRSSKSLIVIVRPILQQGSSRSLVTDYITD